MKIKNLISTTIILLSSLGLCAQNKTRVTSIEEQLQKKEFISYDKRRVRVFLKQCTNIVTTVIE